MYVLNCTLNKCIPIFCRRKKSKDVKKSAEQPKGGVKKLVKGETTDADDEVVDEEPKYTEEELQLLQKYT